jgi:phosphoglucomutase
MESGTMPIAVDAQQTGSPLADQPAAAPVLIDPARLEREYLGCAPDLDDPQRIVRFGTCGYGGSPLRGSFTEAHILAITQAICDFRRRVQGTDGPLYMGKDTHALSTPAQHTALQVLAANGVETVIQQDDGVTPAPAISHAILAYNRDRKSGLADGIVLSASHNPPEDGGLRYSPPNGCPAGTNITHWVEARANQLLRRRNSDVKRVPLMTALLGATTHHTDFVLPYVQELRQIVDMEAIRQVGLKLAADPLGGAAKLYWEAINLVYKLDIAIVNPLIDPTFSFIGCGPDGRIRPDCSSPRAMASLVNWKDRYRLSFGNDPDSNRHGIVTPAGGLMHPNHYLPVAVRYLLTHRPKWRKAAVGKTLVSTNMIDRVVRKLGRRLREVPAAFHWFAPRLLDGSLCFGAAASSGATFLRHDGGVWTTDRDGLIMNLLAAEITVRTGKDPAAHYREMTAEFGTPCYTRIEMPATAEQKIRLERLSPSVVRQSHLAGQPILAKLTHVPGSDDPIGGLKVVAATGWFAARPSGTRDNYKIYAESFWDDAHLDLILADAKEIVNNALNSTERR